MKHEEWLLGEQKKLKELDAQIRQRVADLAKKLGVDELDPAKMEIVRSFVLLELRYHKDPARE